MDFLSILSGLGGILGGAGKSSAEAKQAQNQTALQQFQTELAGRIAQNSAGRNRAADLRTVGGARLGQSATGNMVQNWTPVTRAAFDPANPGASRIGGGFNNLGFDDTTKSIAAFNQNDAFRRAQQGDNAPDISPEMIMPNAPTMSKSSWVDALLGLGGLGGGIAGLFQKPPTVPGFDKGGSMR